MAATELEIAVDIGGTFTDLVLLRRGELVASAKVLTTQPDPSAGVATGVAQLLTGDDPVLVSRVVHGTTLVANALIERKGVTTALVCTEGFRDVLSCRREARYDLYDLFLEMPEPLVPRRRRYELPERVLADGSVDRALDPDQVRRLAPVLREEGVAAVAVCLLHSYRHPGHEEAVAGLLAEELPDVSVSISSEVSPEVGEYHRTSTTVANAYVLPIVDRYLQGIEGDLAAAGVSVPLHIMLSTGGLATAEAARRLPVRMLESGPAAGVLSAGFFGSDEGRRDVLAFDMGGTTAKAALIEGGVPLLAREHEAARVYRFVRGSGHPIRVPVLDLIEIGAGGGSIARVGPFGLPKVGPDSASSDPGPVCYGRGGTRPTVTDADLLLGYLDPGFFLGGEMPLDVEGARRAVADLGADLGLSVEETASAVHRVVNENMASAARMHAIERGRDIRRFSLVATGGAGPVHAWGVARALRIGRLVYPPNAGVASAFGMLTAPPAFEFARSLPGPLRELNWDEVHRLIAEMVEAGRGELAAPGRAPVRVGLSADLRYQGQGDSITVDLGMELEDLTPALVADRFHDEYLRLFGSRPPEVEPEVLTWRVRVAGEQPRPSVGFGPGAAGEPMKGTRRMWFAEAGGMVEAAVYDRYLLRAGMKIEGPMAVEERESTVVVGPGGVATVDDAGNLEVETGG